MEYTTLNNGVKMPMAGIGTFLLTPDEAEASCVSALQNGYRMATSSFRVPKILSTSRQTSTCSTLL